MAATEKSGLSFGFTRKSEKRKLKTSVVGEGVERSEEDTDFVLSLEGQEVKSTKPKEKAKQYVIPLITKNNWRPTAEEQIQDELQKQALKEIIADTAKRNNEWTDRDKDDPSVAIPLLMINRIPDGFETEENLDVALRPDEPEEADYEEIPIEQYGLAMLRGMGWMDGEGIGKKKEIVKPVVAELRPKGLGLGADRSQASKINEAKNGRSEKEGDEQLILKKGAFCAVQKGPHKDLYGVVEGVDEDNARLMVKLTLSGQMVTVSQYGIKLVDAREYKKYSKYINKGKVDRIKEKEDLKEKQRRGKDKDREHRDKSEHHRSRLEEDDGGGDTNVSHRSKDGEEGHRKRKYDSTNDRHVLDIFRKDEELKSSKGSSSQGIDSANGNSSRHDGTAIWLRPKIRVRIVDRHYLKGKYYNAKVEVIDVLSKENCVCKTEDGKVLEELCQSSVETVIPKSDPAYVVIVGGKYRGQMAEVIKKDKTNCIATLQLLRDRNLVVKVDYDSICEYVGDINDEFDY